MDTNLLLVILGLAFALLFQFLSVIKREGLSSQFIFEAMFITFLVAGAGYLTGTTTNPLFFLVFLYLITMRSRLLTDLASFLSTRGRQRNAISILQVALRLYPDKQTRLIVLVNMGIVQLLRKNPQSAEAILASTLEEAKTGGLGLRYQAACHYNLGIALRQLGQDSRAVGQFRLAADTFPGSAYSKAALQALEERRRGKKKT
jgi:tetratricopeptide (TPR) repeat protein